MPPKPVGKQAAVTDPIPRLISLQACCGQSTIGLAASSLPDATFHVSPSRRYPTYSEVL